MGDPVIFVVAVVIAAALGVYGEQLRAARARKMWAARRDQKAVHLRPVPSKATPPTDGAEQLRAVMAATFAKRRILSKSEAQVFQAAEQAIKTQGLGWRVMAQVSLGEVLSSRDATAYAAINSKRVDLLVISSGGEPIAAFEYQGSGHYQGSAPVRDAVKKEALRRAGVRYVEITPEHDATDIAREIARLGGTVAPSAA